MSGAFVCTRRKFNGGVERAISRPGSVGIIPADFLYAGQSTAGGEFFGIQFGQSLLTKAAGDDLDADKIEMTSNFAATNSQIGHMGLVLLAEKEIIKSKSLLKPPAYCLLPGREGVKDFIHSEFRVF